MSYGAAQGHHPFYDRLHTCASPTFLRDVHPKFVQELLGHASIVTTLDK